MAEDTGDRLFPYFNRPPRLPQKIQGAAENIMARWHAWKRTGDMICEAGGVLSGETVKVGGFEFVTSVASEEVPVQRIEKDNAGVLRRRSLFSQRSSLGSMM